jgi:cytidylate kinase
VRARDERDTNREVSPLVAAQDAIEIDTSELSIDEVLDEVLNIALLKGLM